MNIPENNAVCPCCNGTGVGEALTEDHKKYSFWAHLTHFQCQNCGGQTMTTKALGYTWIDPSTGLGCHHVFKERRKGNCLHEYKCAKCDFCYDIDSSD